DIAVHAAVVFVPRTGAAVSHGCFHDSFLPAPRTAVRFGAVRNRSSRKKAARDVPCRPDPGDGRMRSSVLWWLAPREWQSLAMRAGPLALLIFTLADGLPAQTNRPQEDVDSPGLVIEAIAGWDGTVDKNAPIPVSFLIRND